MNVLYIENKHMSHHVPVLPKHAPHKGKCLFCGNVATHEARLENHTVVISINCCIKITCTDNAKDRAKKRWEEHLETVRKAKEEKLARMAKKSVNSKSKNRSQG